MGRLPWPEGRVGADCSQIVVAKYVNDGLVWIHPSQIEDIQLIVSRNAAFNPRLN